MAHETQPKTLPADLSAPAFVGTWQNRALMVGVVCSVAAVILALLGQAQDGLGWDHLLRAWTLGTLVTWGFAVGGLALLMVQYCSGGKWGLLLRRPLEAMSRTLPLIFVYWAVMAIFMKRMYLWAQYTTASDTAAALKSGLISECPGSLPRFQAPDAEPRGLRLGGLALLRHLGLLHLAAEFAGPEARCRPAREHAFLDQEIREHFRAWHRDLLRHHDGVIHLLGHVDGRDVVLNGLRAALPCRAGLSGAGACHYCCHLALSKAEPYKTILRQTEQHDLGKLTFAFVMLNIYLNFGQFLIIWSGNLPNEINWYLDRIRGGWGVIITLDFIFHWLVPFTMLLSRDLKRNKKRLVRVCQFMIFAVAFNQFWLIEPNFKDAARNLHFSWGILEYIAVPVAMIAFWLAYYCTRLKTRGAGAGERSACGGDSGA